MFRLKFSPKEMKEELGKYISDIETWYSEMVKKYKGLYRKAVDRIKRMKRMEGSNKDAVSYLQETLLDAIEKTRIQIFKRRMKAETGQKHKDFTVGVRDLSKDTAPEEHQEMLDKLHLFIKGKVKQEDFTAKDKTNLVEAFVMNYDVLRLVYETLFPRPDKKKD